MNKCTLGKWLIELNGSENERIRPYYFFVLPDGNYRCSLHVPNAKTVRKQLNARTKKACMVLIHGGCGNACSIITITSNFILTLLVDGYYGKL